MQNRSVQTSTQLLKIIRSGDFQGKRDALLMLRKMDIDTGYQICPVCDRVGKRVTRISNGKETPFIYHYTASDGKHYCSIKDAVKLKKRRERKVTCPKCGREGLFSRKKCVQCAYENGDKARIYGVTRLVVRHGSKICYINKTHLKELRKKYGFKYTRITFTHPAMKFSDDIINKEVRDKGVYDLSDLKNRFGMSLTGIKRTQHIIRTLEGQLKAKNEGKDIRFDVEKRLNEFKTILALKEGEGEEKIKAKEMERESEDPLLRDEWFVQHQEKLRSTEVLNS